MAAGRHLDFCRITNFSTSAVVASEVFQVGMVNSTINRHKHLAYRKTCGYEAYTAYDKIQDGVRPPSWNLLIDCHF